MGKYLVIDVGGTNIKYALMDEENILEKNEILTPYNGLECFIETIGILYDKYMSQIKGIALSVPGRVDMKTGFMYTGGSLQYIQMVPMADLLKARCPLPISVENDGKCAALAELWKGSLVGIDNGLVLTLGTGIGGGVIVNGKLIRGSHFAAGELSCLPISLNTFEQDLNLWAYINGTNSLINNYCQLKNLNPKHITGRDFFDAVDKMDSEALYVLNQFCTTFVNGLFSIQTVLDIQKVAIGGGISSQSSLIDTIRLKLDELFASLPTFLPIQKMEVVKCTYGNDSNLYGALYHHLHE